MYYKVSKEIKGLYYLRISRGCLSNCSYCAIRFAIGPLKSKPINECIKEFKKGLDAGYKKFIIVADDLGAYGQDINTDFPTLLNELLKIEGEYEIELEESHPRWIVKYFDDLKKIISNHGIKKICIPIQSGSSRILKLMNRYSDVEKIKDMLIKLKTTDSDIIIGTNFMVGFPTEEIKDFKNTIKLLKDVKFDYGAVFPFSCKTGTPAENIEPKISTDEIKNRMKKVEDVLNDMNYHFFYYKETLMFYSS
jgi:MiaB/RimO family radical SAM methylthiotransferase